MKRNLFFLFLIVALGCAKKHSNFNEYPISAITIKDVDPYYLWSNRGVGNMQVWFPR